MLFEMTENTEISPQLSRLIKGSTNTYIWLIAVLLSHRDHPSTHILWRTMHVKSMDNYFCSRKK